MRLLRIGLLVAFSMLAAALFAASASADEGFGLKELDVTFTDAHGAPDMRAGGHPFGWTTSFYANTEVDPDLGELPIGAVKDLTIEAPAGLVGDPKATPRCTAIEFADLHAGEPSCKDSSVVGKTIVRVALSVSAGEVEEFGLPVYNLVPPPGAPAKFGFVALTVPYTFEAKIKPEPPYNVFASLVNVPQPVRFYGSKTTIWGNPAGEEHDLERGRCASLENTTQSCPVDIPERPFLTMPRRCEGPLLTRLEVDSWQEPGHWLPPYELQTHDDSVPPKPLGTIDCQSLGFAPEISSQPTTDQADSPTGLDFHLEIDDNGLVNPDGRAQSDIRKAVVALPKGVTANPSAAEGLATCSEADLARETVDSEPGEGCPQASNVGTVEVETPLLEGELITGQVFVATQDQNPFHSLLALYMVIKDPELGVMVKLPGKVEPDPQTGQLVTTFGEPPHELPQVPFSDFRFHFRQGGRSLLVTPPGCGSFETRAVFTPWANPANPLTRTASFEIGHGVGGGPCPAGGRPPFEPGFSAGSLNNAAGGYSPFYLRLTRRDGDQDLTKFSFQLPPGLVAKLAGVARCPDNAIALARGRSGREELASPSCPADSEIGSVIGGAGVGSQLTYVPGKVYLAGPYNGAPLSAVGVVPAVAGPFDVGTVVTRQALDIDPRTAEAFLDGSRSDPIPHILAGIPLRVRDIRVNINRPDFTLNPTDCDPFWVGAQLWGGGADVFSAADDSPVSRSERFQAANCASLRFRPRLQLKLRGGARRGDHPALRVLYRPRAGDANLRRLALAFPRSEFVENANFRTICTKVQYAAQNCPPDSVYGNATAFTPLLDEPLKGPVYLRSSDHLLPDAVLALHGLVDAEVAVRIDSVRGRLRATVENAPDVPVSQVIVNMQGGDKGLFVNSRNVCSKTYRARAAGKAHNGRVHSFKPAIGTRCRKKRSR